VSGNTITDLETLPAFCRARILVLGVGNILFGDDGFGPAVAETLLRDYLIPEDVYVMDVGTGIRKLLFTIALSEIRPEEIIIADAVDWGHETGAVLEIPVEALPDNKIDDFSLHQVPTSNMLHELQVYCGVKVSVVACDVGIVPQWIAAGLSPEIERAVVTTCQKIAQNISLRLK